MGRQDVGRMVDHMALWAAEQEIERLRLAQEMLNRQVARLARAVGRGVWRAGEATDMVVWPGVPAQLEYWLELQALCAPARLAQMGGGDDADYRLRAIMNRGYIDGLRGAPLPGRKK